VTTSAPSLSLRSLLGKSAVLSALGRAHVTAGLTPASKALAAVHTARAAGALTLLVVPTDRDVEQMTSDARFFYGALGRGRAGRAAAFFDSGRSVSRHDAAFPRGGSEGAGPARRRSWNGTRDRRISSGVAAARESA
jgi:hypothetical protein